jgi:heterodisulfide reductase subunit D
MASLEILHATEYLAELIEGGRLPLREKRQIVAYHDPCDLGRKSKVYQAPRRVLQCIPGLTTVEMSDTRETALCYSGRGSLERYGPFLVARLSARRLAQAIVSACQQCERALSNACRQQNVRMRVLDITEIAWEAAEK